MATNDPRDYCEIEITFDHRYYLHIKGLPTPLKKIEITKWQFLIFRMDYNFKVKKKEDDE